MSAAAAKPPVLAPPVPGDVQAPRIRWSIADAVGLAGQLTRPITAVVRVDESASIVAELRLTARAARSLGVPALVDTATVSTPAAGTRNIALRFPPKVRHALASRNGVLLVLRLRVTDSSGNVRTAAKPLHLQR